ncbi:MAG: hypothetical protein GX117_12275 [Candidatus Hydrogenedentes bacterium]|jgi:hypothetical protein|nr:hypothetical protein [Candidatus Hydrogenedentota bacterium]
MQKFLTITILLFLSLSGHSLAQGSWLPEEISTSKLAPPFFLAPGKVEAVAVAAYDEHVRGKAETHPDWENAVSIRLEEGAPICETHLEAAFDGGEKLAEVQQGTLTWIGTTKGLYYQEEGKISKYEQYGVNGPLASTLSGMVLDSKNNLWVGTALGLSRRNTDGQWTHFQGKQGLPVEDIRALAIDMNDTLWIGSARGLIIYKPYAQGRQWFYRAGQRYLPGDMVKSIAVKEDGSAAWLLTDKGVGKIVVVRTSLLEKASTIEKRVNERHRRFGLVADCVFDDADKFQSYTIPDKDNDGLWTAYHVAAMSLCFATTKDPAAKVSARESMHALYMLQNVSGIPGLVARSVVPEEIGKTKSKQWRPTEDHSLYWKSDTSSDEIDGHYFAFYTYYEYVAKEDEAERALIEEQVRALTDYLINNNYQLIDWNGKRTRWGFWNPESLNNNPMNYMESGLNALQILSFLKVAHHITGDARYEEHYRKLIVEHHYLENVVISKKHFPDENNHSDDQLGFVAWYPILQLEKDPKLRRILAAGVRRHYAVVEPEKSSFYTFVYATVDPAGADIDGAIENLQEIPTDRRLFRATNSHRDDVIFSSRVNRFGKDLITRVLPADERCFAKWNADPYVPDTGNSGLVEDDGAAYLLPYWMGRYHNFIEEAEDK